MTVLGAALTRRGKIQRRGTGVDRSREDQRSPENEVEGREDDDSRVPIYSDVSMKPVSSEVQHESGRSLVTMEGTGRKTWTLEVNE